MTDLFGKNYCSCGEEAHRKVNGRYKCSEHIKHAKERTALKLEMTAKKVPCPICHKKMIKKKVQENIIDLCKRHGIWLDKKELYLLQNEACDDDGYTTGFVNGINIGMVGR